MSALSAAHARLRARYMKLSRRERALTVFAAVALVIGLGEMTLIDPALRQRSALLRQIAAQKAERDTLRQQLSGAERDPNTALKAQLLTLQGQLRSTDNEFKALQNGLVQPQHMGALLQSLLTEHKSLKLLGLRSLPVAPLGETLASQQARATPATTERASTPGAAATGAVASASPASVAASSAGRGGDDAWLYRHAVEIRVQGSYADMVSYLQALESLPRRVRWGDLEIDARNYPADVMTVTIFTVSLEKSWWVL